MMVYPPIIEKEPTKFMKFLATLACIGILLILLTIYSIVFFLRGSI